MYQEKGVAVPETMAALLLSAILSDTLMFRSPTCTAVDESAAKELAQIAQIEITELAGEMFKAGSNLSHKSAEEIFYQDFKKFSVDGVNFGIGQISFMSYDEQHAIKKKMRNYLDKVGSIDGIETIYFMLTNILDETTELIYSGDAAERLIEEAYGITSDNGEFILKGVVSRKKQLLPRIMTAIQN
jgi:manganese-dependent inorganic pyrophosphatase